MLFYISYDKKDFQKYVNKTFNNGVKKKSFHINESLKREDFNIGDVVVTKFFCTLKFVARICKINKIENKIKEIKCIVLHVLKSSNVVKRGDVFLLDLCCMAVLNENGNTKFSYKINKSEIIWENSLLNF